MTTSIAERLYADHRPSRRINYGSVRVIRARVRDKKRQRTRSARGRWIVGRFILRGSVVLLEAVPISPGFWIDPHRPLSTNFHEFYRWCTRQAARQWLLRHPDPRCQPVNLETLRGCQPEHAISIVTAATGPQPRSVVTAATDQAPRIRCHPDNPPAAAAFTPRQPGRRQ